MDKKGNAILLLVLIMIIAVGGAYYFNYSLFQQDNSSDLQNTPIITQERYSSSIFKEPTSFEGYQYCSFIFEDEEYFNLSRFRFKPVCNISDYPIIKDFLYDFYLVTLIEFDNVYFAAQYTGNGVLEINDHFKVAKNLDMTLAHEIAHSATENLNLPDWLSEGIADYAAYRYFKVQFKLDDNIKHPDILHWEVYSSDYGGNIRGYADSAHIIKRFVDKYGDDKLRELIIELYGKINRGDSIDMKNQKILEVIKKVVNNPNFSFDEII